MKLYFLILFSAFLIFSCKQSEENQVKKAGPVDESFIVSVDGVNLSEKDLAGKNPEKVIDTLLLYNEALKNGADKKVEEKYKKHEEKILSNSSDNNTLKYLEEDYRQKLIIDYFIYNMLVSDEDLDEATVKKYYQENLYDYESITVDEIIFTDKKLAEEFLEKIKSGKKFDALKKEYISSEKGSMDFYIINDPIYKRDLQGIEKDTVYDGIIAKNGQFRVVNVIENNTIPFNTVKKYLKGKVRAEIGERKSRELVKNLRKNAEIIYYSEAIKQQKSPKLNKSEFLGLTKNCNNIPDSYAKTTCYKPFFQSVVYTNSGAYALKLAKKLEKDGVIKDCHLFSHHIGATLLEKYNFDLKKAFNSCSKECIQGCYHGVLEEYISTSNWKPEEVSSRGLNLCESITDDKLLLRQCVHGVGHGLIAKKFTPLMNAINICRDINTARYQHACLGGVFMEYMDIFLPLNEKELIELVSGVCDEVDSLNDIELSSKCYHAVGQGFMFYSGNNLKKSKELCKYTKPEYQEECINAAEFMATGHHEH